MAVSKSAGRVSKGLREGDVSKGAGKVMTKREWAFLFFCFLLRMSPHSQYWMSVYSQYWMYPCSQYWMFSFFQFVMFAYCQYWMSPYSQYWMSPYS